MQWCCSVIVLCAVVTAGTGSTGQSQQNTAGKRDAFSGLDQPELLHDDTKGQGSVDVPVVTSYGWPATFKSSATNEQVTKLLDELLYYRNGVNGGVANLKDEQLSHLHNENTQLPLYPPLGQQLDLNKQYVWLNKPFFDGTSEPLKVEQPEVHKPYFTPEVNSYEHGLYNKLQQLLLAQQHTSHETKDDKTTTVEKLVPYPVPVKTPYPVSVPQPYPVPIEKPIPYPVVKPVPYPVHYPVPVENYNPTSAFKANKHAFSHSHQLLSQLYSYHDALSHKPDPHDHHHHHHHIPRYEHLPHDYHIPEYAQFLFEYHDHDHEDHHDHDHDEEEEEEEDHHHHHHYDHKHKGQCKDTKKWKTKSTTSKPHTTTSKPSFKANLLKFLLQNISS